jgi:hypothetical protein
MTAAGEALSGDTLRAILNPLSGIDLTCARLTCRLFRDHSSPAQQPMLRSGFLRTRARAVFAWERMPGFVTPGFNLNDGHRLLCLAASVGHVAVLEEMVDNWQCALSCWACDSAAKHGHLDAVAYLHGRGFPWSPVTCQVAAHEGHLDVLQYAHEHGGVLSDALNVAAEAGHLAVVIYAHEHGCAWDRDSCWRAARGGRLEVLRYLHEHGCAWDRNTPYVAADEGHLEVLRYAVEHGCELPHASCVEEARRAGHAAIAAFLMPFLTAHDS